MNYRNIFTAVAFSLLFFFNGAVAHSELRVGAGKADITPAPGCYMGGYYMRNAKATGVHDRLYARAVMYDNGEKKVALVTLDLVIIGGVLVNDVKAEIGAKLGIPPEMISISATHTHSGPEGYYEEYGKYPKTVDMEMKKAIMAGIIEAVQQADARLAPATVGFVEFALDGFNHNRHDGAGPADREAVLMVARDSAGKTIAGFLNFAAHPTIMDADNLLLSGDWAGIFAQTMEKKLGEGVVFQYVQGATGNLSPDAPLGSSFESCSDIAERMSESVLKRVDEAQPKSDLKIAGVMKKLVLPVKSSKEVAEFARSMPDLKKEIAAMNISEDQKNQRISWLDGKLGTEQFMGMLIRGMSRVKKGKTESSIQAIRLGDVVIMAMPGETITEHSINFRKALAPSTVVVQAYANDHLGYIVNEKVGKEGGYESAMGIVNWEQCERVAAETLDLAKGIMSGE